MYDAFYIVWIARLAAVSAVITLLFWTIVSFIQSCWRAYEDPDEESKWR